jgi:hypothetical protein
MKLQPVTTEQPKALDTLTAIVDHAMAFRFAEQTPTLADIARIVGASSRVLRIADLDERISVENAALLVIAKKRNLVS